MKRVVKDCFFIPQAIDYIFESRGIVVSRPTIANWIKHGYRGVTLTAVKHGSHQIIRKEVLDEYLRHRYG